MKLKNNHLIWSLFIITIYPILTYLLLIPFLGFYNDDWLFAYIGHFYGQAGLTKAFIGDRPFLGYLFTLNHNFIGENIFLWHLYMFLMRLFGGYALFFLLKKIWPNKLSIITSITILFLTYPGFLHQTDPLGYQNYITALTIWITSLFLTILAGRENKFSFVLLTIGALILQITSLLTLEFFIGLEILRLLFIFYLLKIELNVTQLKKKIIFWGPYILSLTLFLIWRVFIFKATRHATNLDWITQTYYSNPIWIVTIPLKIIYSFFSAVLLAYFVPFIIKLISSPNWVSFTCLFLGSISSFLLYPYYKITHKPEAADKYFGKTIITFGLISVLIALIPIILSGRFANVFLDNNNYDRYTISSILGVTFIHVGMLIWKGSKKAFKWVMLLLVAISITTQLLNGYWHIRYSDIQKNIWWQIYWRAPQIQKDTLLVFNIPENIELYKLLRLEDYQIWAPGNLFFNYYIQKDNHFGGQYLESNTIQKMRNNVIEDATEENGAVTFTKNFANTIIISLPTDDSCLWILDKDRLELPDSSSKLLKSSISYSDVNGLIQKGTIIPPSQIFGDEPTKNWCYYFQKASLARQFKDWRILSDLMIEVTDKNLKPKDINEWLPFIEGLIINQQYSQAKGLIKMASESRSQNFTKNLCQMLSRVDIVEFKKYCD